jgi:integrase
VASLQKKVDSWHLQFLYKNQRRTWVLGDVPDDEAWAEKGRVEERLMRIRQGFITVPAGMDIVDFLACGGKPPEQQPPTNGPSGSTTFAELRDAYLKSHGNGTVEKNTFETIKLHLSHFATTLGEGFPAAALTFADLQRHVDRRTRERNRAGNFISPVTVKKEVATLSAVWSWAKRMKLVQGEFPGRGLRYPKLDEPPPFMTWGQVERAIKAGGDEDELWDCLYLRVAEILELLAYVKEHATHAFIYPMFCFAAFTGARRSEMLRAQVVDLDLAGEVVTLREKKRKAGTRTLRRVPLTPFLARVMKEWLAEHPGGPHLFCIAGVVARSKKRSRTTGHKSQKTRATSLKGRLATVRQRGEQPVAPLSIKEAYDHFKRTLAGSKWQVLKGWHVLRHSFISACATKGTDQRLLDEWCGHSTEQQRKRYRHLWPDEQQQEIANVFGQ